MAISCKKPVAKLRHQNKWQQEKPPVHLWNSGGMEYSHSIKSWIMKPKVGLVLQTKTLMVKRFGSHKSFPLLAQKESWMYISWRFTTDFNRSEQRTCKAELRFPFVKLERNPFCGNDGHQSSKRFFKTLHIWSSFLAQVPFCGISLWCGVCDWNPGTVAARDVNGLTGPLDDAVCGVFGPVLNFGRTGKARSGSIT